MDASSPPRRKTFNDIGRTDSSLAQWTSEIRKLQSEVDREAEEESRRLQEEIAASRLEREKRRGSHRQSGGTPHERVADTNPRTNDDESPKDMLSTIDRQHNQRDTLKKLVGEDTAPAPVLAGPPSISPSQPTSLASIIGGKATGPRLNKHAPQHVVEDSNGRTFLASAVELPARQVASVPLPGLQTPKSGAGNTPSTADRVDSSQNLPSTSTAMPKIPGTPARAPKPALARPSSIEMSRPKKEEKRQEISQTPPRTPTRETKPSMSSPTTKPLIGNPTPASPSSSHKVVSPPPLARPVQPSASAPRQNFKLPQNTSPSPAFLRPLPTKELTPSLTRLQGRGFVAKSVQAGGIASVDTTGQQNKPAATSSPVVGKKPTVLDRWVPVVNEPTTLPNKDASTPKPSPYKLLAPAKPSATVPNHATSQAVNPIPAFRASSSPSSTSDTFPKRSPPATGPKPSASPVALPGLSSRILPVKKSEPSANVPPMDSPVTQGSQLTSSREVKATPLNHPTRDRARKPKKTQGSQGTARTDSANGATPKQASEPLGVQMPITPPDSLGHAGARALSSPPKPMELAKPLVPSSPRPKVVRSVSDESQNKRSPCASPAASSNVARLAGAWGDNKPISAREVPAGGMSTREVQSHGPSSAIRRALPGMTSSEKFQAPLSTSGDATSGSKRPTAMEIAQGLQEHQRAGDVPAEKSSRLEAKVSTERSDDAEAATDVRNAIANWGRAAPTPGKPAAPPSLESLIARDAARIDSPTEQNEPESPVDVKSAIASWARPTSTTVPAPTTTGSPATTTSPIPRPSSAPPNPQRDPVKAERRRSNLHEKYASIILPPLAEEKTPAPTPVGSIARREGSTADVRADRVSVSGVDMPPTEKHRRTPSAFEMHQALMEHKALVDIIAPSTADSPPVPKSHLPLASKAARELVELPIHDDVALPIVDVLRIPPATQPVSLTSDEPTISVEVFAVAGGTTTPITTDFHIFYDEEVRAIIHRYKVKTSGLVSTRVFGWRGRQAEVGASEAKKLGELASRFGTTLIPCIQGSEPLELVRILGNTLVTRQGPRAHWTAENTAMHCVRQVKGAIYIDQVEPERKNLCSAFSYVATVLDAIFVFHGKGATQSEREAALKYAQSISPPNREPVEFEESHEDEMFTMVLGEEQHAMADFWRFRSAANDCAAVLYRVDSDQSPPVQRLNEVAAECLEPGAVFVLDGTFEVFVIVGADARGYRKDIRLAISVAQQLAALQAAKRPFTPPVHVLILPSQVPMDLRVGHVRFLDEELLNSGDIPNHMNLIPLSEAFEQLSKSAWPRGLLEDPSFLPLGVSPDDIPIQS